MNWLEHTKTCLLDLRDMDLEDTTFLIPSFSNPDRLESSIARFGIVNPPLVLERAEARPIPLLGRRRLFAAQKLGVSQVHARMVPGDVTEQEGFRLAFWDNIACRPFGVACTAFVVKRLLELFPREQVARDFLPALNVPRQGPRVERLKAIGGLEFPVLVALGSGRLHEKTAWILSKMETHERSALLRLCDDLSLNANKTAEVVESMFDLAAFESRPVLDFLQQQPVRGILSDAELSTQQRSAGFRELLRDAKFPELGAKEKEFRDRFAAHQASQRISVRPTAGFESPECTVQVRCNSADEAAALIQQLKDEW